MKVLICGGRLFSDKNFFNMCMADFFRDNDIDLIMQGGAEGVDYLVKRWAEIADIPIEDFDSDWEKYKPDVMLVFHGGTGTFYMISCAKRSGIKVIEFSPHGGTAA